MKVAILGAGLSGLACAKYLEDNNITPVIFEKRHRVGERFPNMEAVMQIMHRPVKDAIIYLNKEFGINLLPGGIMHTLEIHSPNHTAMLTGYNLGYTSIRGHDDRSWECQLEKQIKTKIQFDSTVTWQELEKDFDRIIVATGDPTISRELGVWKTDSEAFLKGCIVKGHFDLGVSKIWFNTKFSKNCMVYFAPFDTKKASYCTVCNPASQEELDTLWARAIVELKIDPVPQTEFKFEEYKLGRVSTRQIGKILLTGAAGGFVEPFMGFGQIPSLLSGVYAAQSIITGKDYNRLTAWYNKQYASGLTLRKFMNTLDNDGYDKIVSALHLPMLTYLIANTNLPILDLTAKLVGILNFFGKLNGSKNDGS